MNGEHKFKCDACGKDKSEISSTFKSCIHKHNAAGKTASAFKIVGEVRNVKTDEPAFICQECAVKLTSAAAAGGNVVLGK